MLSWGEQSCIKLMIATANASYSFCWGFGGVAGAIIGGTCECIIYFTKDLKYNLLCCS